MLLIIARNNPNSALPARKPLIIAEISPSVAYATLRLLGHSEADAARGVLEARPMGRLVPAYRASVERWLAQRAAQTADTQTPPGLR